MSLTPLKVKDRLIYTNPLMKDSNTPKEAEQVIRFTKVQIQNYT